MLRFVLALGALLGLSMIFMGVAGAHILPADLAPEQRNWFDTAWRFHQTHALAVLAIGLAGQGPVRASHALLRSSAFGIGMTLGTLLFSGSLYGKVFYGWELGIVTPIGGLLLAASWAGLLVLAAIPRRNRLAR